VIRYLGAWVCAAGAVEGHTKITKEAKLTKGSFASELALRVLRFLRVLRVTQECLRRCHDGRLGADCQASTA
jgi:hypothetical protein